MADLFKSFGDAKVIELPVWFKKNVNVPNVQTAVNNAITNYG